MNYSVHESAHGFEICVAVLAHTYTKCGPKTLFSAAQAPYCRLPATLHERGLFLLGWATIARNEQRMLPHSLGINIVNLLFSSWNKPVTKLRAFRTAIGALIHALLGKTFSSSRFEVSS